MGNNLLARNAVIEVAGYCGGKCRHIPVSTTAVAPLAGRDQVRLVITAALAMRNHMIQGEEGAILNGCATVDTRETITEINAQSFGRPYPL
jgi:hypothetical protein